MKKIYFFLFFYVSILNAQEMVKNGGFEETQTKSININCNLFFTCICEEQLLCRNPTTPSNMQECLNNPNHHTTQDYDFEPFFREKLKHWKSSHGTAQVEMIGCANNKVASGNISAYIDGRDNNQEGIFQEGINLEVGTTYNISFNVEKLGIEIYICDGLTNQTGAIPNISTKEKLFPNGTPNEIMTFNANTGFTHVEIKNYKVQSQHSQLWIFSTSSDNVIDDISIFKTCCINHQVYENVTNPPSTHVNEWIHANPNQPASNTDVTYTIPTQRRWTAKDNINIKQNFYIGRHTSFNAKLQDCNTISIDGYISALTGAQGDDPCDTYLTAEACYGSGNYAYEWKINGQIVCTDQVFKINQNTPFYIVLKITDIITGLSIERTFDYRPCGCPVLDLYTGWPNDIIEYCPEKDGRNCFKIGPAPEKDIVYSWSCNDAQMLTWLSNTNISNPQICIPPTGKITNGASYVLNATSTNNSHCNTSKNITINCCTPTINIPAHISLCQQYCYEIPLTPQVGYTYEWTDETNCSNPNPNYTISATNIANPIICFNNPLPMPYGVLHCSQVKLKLKVTNACGIQVISAIDITEPGFIYDGCNAIGVNLDYIQNTQVLNCNFSVHNGLENIIKHVTVKIFDENHNEIKSKTFYEGVNFFMPTTNVVQFGLDNLYLDCTKNYYIQYFYGTDCSYYDIPFNSMYQIILNCI